MESRKEGKDITERKRLICALWKSLIAKQKTFKVDKRTAQTGVFRIDHSSSRKFAWDRSTRKILDSTNAFIWSKDASIQAKK